MRTSVIQHPARSPFLMVREDYLEICERDQCAAIVLAALEFKTNGVMDNTYEREAPWIAVSISRLSDDMLGTRCKDSILDAISYLSSRGFIETQRAPGTTNLYRLCVDAIHAAIYHGGPSEDQSKNRQVPVEKSTGSPDPSLLTVKEEVQEEPPTPSPTDLPPLTGNVVKAVKSRMDSRGLGTSLSQSTCQQIRKKESWFRSQGSEEHRDFLDGLARTIDDFAEDPSIGTINSALMGYQRGKESRERAPKVGFSHPERKPPPASRAESPAQRRIAEAFQEHGFMLGEEMDWKWRVLEARLADQGNDGFWPWLEAQLSECEDLGLSSGGAFEALFTEAKRLAMRKPTFEEELADSMKGEAL